VERQKLHTALADAAEANSTGAPQLGQAARQARDVDEATDFER
jgi:hypothetical protein